LEASPLASSRFRPVENDWGDRLDDIGLLVAGIACLVWYMIGRDRFRRSVVPVVFAGLALAVQVLAILLERDDPAAFGDNFGGLVMLIPFFIFVLVQFILTGRALIAAERATTAEEHATSPVEIERKV